MKIKLTEHGINYKLIKTVNSNIIYQNGIVNYNNNFNNLLMADEFSKKQLKLELEDFNKKKKLSKDIKIAILLDEGNIDKCLSISQEIILKNESIIYYQDDYYSFIIDMGNNKYITHSGEYFKLSKSKVNKINTKLNENYDLVFCSEV